MPELSLAVVTRNRPVSLERTLQSIREQAEQPLEIIVSDDSDTSAQDSVRSLCAQYGASYRVGPRRGLYANRNAAALACAGSHIRTVDDDHTFPAGHFAACSAGIRLDPAAIWIIGERTPGAPPGVELRCPPQLHPRGYSTTPATGERMWAIADGATIYPREVFEAGHRFYEGFNFGAAYLEWGSRLRWLGYDIRHLATTFVIHHFDGRSFDDEALEASSRVFAALSHSFIYQPTLRNRISTAAQIGAIVVKQRARGLRAAQRGARAFVDHRKTISRQSGHYPTTRHR